MGVLQRFERRLEGLVEGAFARAFKGRVEPVEIAGALTREAEDKAAIVGPGRTLVPNDYVVELGPDDFARLGQYAEPLTVELAEMMREAAGEHHWSFVGPVSITFAEVTELDTGVFRVRSGVTSPSMFEGGLQYSAGPLSESDPHQAVLQQSAGVYQGNPRLVFAVGGKAPAGTVEARGGERVYELVQPTTIIGRGHDVDLRLLDPGVSRHHARVEVAGPETFVTDLGSTNGTTLDGVPVTGPSAMASGQRITIGRTALVFMRDAQPDDS